MQAEAPCTNLSLAGQNLSAGLGSGGVNLLSSDKFQRSINEGDFQFLKFLPFDELTKRMAGRLTCRQEKNTFIKLEKKSEKCGH